MERRTVSEGEWKGEGFRRTLVGIVRKRVPERDVEDIVQATLTEALSPSAPTDDEALQRWLIGVVRHKIADRTRRGQRESFELPEQHADAPPHSARDLVRWAERALPEGGEEPQRTLEWMIREGDGEKLESIAESEQIPAPRVRKRVSRLRQHLRAQWKKEVALLAALGIVALLVWIQRRQAPAPVAHDSVQPVPSEVAPTLHERAERMRDQAIAACDHALWSACIDGLDRGREMDPAGDAEERVVNARAAANAALNPVPVPTSVPAPAPTIAPAPSSLPRSAPTSSLLPSPAPSFTSDAPRKAAPSKKPGPSSGSSGLSK